jgi:hypothetical protein
MTANLSFEPRWPLYHGTTTLHLRQIRQDNVLRVSPTGEKVVSLTPDRSVAEAASLCALVGDCRDRPGSISQPVILVLDGEALVGRRYVLEARSDDTPDEEGYDWENELASEEDIDPLHEVLVRIERVPLDRFEIWQRGDIRLFHAPRPWILERLLARDENGFRRLCDEVLRGDRGVTKRGEQARGTRPKV